MPDSEKTISGWFHCGRCGELFRARTGEGEIRTCDACGRDPIHDQWEVGASFSSVLLPVQRDEEEARNLPDEPKQRRKRRKNALALLVLLWVGLLALLVLCARWYWQSGDDAGQERPLGGIRSHLAQEDRKFLHDHIPAVSKVFASHVVAANDAQRAQTVVDPLRIAPMLTRYYEMNPLIRIDLEHLSVRSAKVLRLPEGEAIEVLWQSGDREYDSVFFRQDGEWKLDWEHFVRHSEFPLSLFLAGSGPDEAEFRLFARERLAAERKKEPELSVVLYSVVAGRPSDAGVQTPAFLVPRIARNGKRLGAGFQQAREGRVPFDSQLQMEKPEDLIRVRVRLVRKEVDGLRVFEIKDVVACHWYGLTDAPGVPDEEAELEKKN